MKNKVFSLLSAAVLVLALSSIATATTGDEGCTPSATVACFDLTQQNGNLGSYLPDTDYGDVKVSITGTTQVTITFTAEAGWMFHNNGVGWNEVLPGGASISGETVACSGANGSPTCPGTPTGGGNEDGFGSFTNRVGGVGNGSSDGWTTITITINGTGLALSDFTQTNGTGTIFAAQLSPFPNLNPTSCTGFVGDSGSPVGTAGTTGNASCGAGGSTPEPGSLALFGTGILGMAGYLRRKLLS